MTRWKNLRVTDEALLKVQQRIEVFENAMRRKDLPEDTRREYAAALCGARLVLRPLRLWQPRALRFLNEAIEDAAQALAEEEELQQKGGRK